MKKVQMVVQTSAGDVYLAEPLIMDDDNKEYMQQVADRCGDTICRQESYMSFIEDDTGSTVVLPSRVIVSVRYARMR
jgi:hypothetical protein